MVAAGSIICAAGAAASPSVVSLQCEVVKSPACVEAKACRSADGDVGQSYSFDLAAMTYQAPHDRGAITELQTKKGFMTFQLGDGSFYVHKDVGEGDPFTSYLYGSPHEMRKLQCTARYDPMVTEADAEERRRLAGHYYLSGVMETASELLLRPDGRFAWIMSYGAVDQEVQGKWRVDGGAVLLEAQPGSGASPAFRQLRLRIDHGSLLLNGAVRGRYDRHP
ncbi:hypothetical protein SAMN05192583_2097 [Sphingomonas gellani]|uniref:Uncharacterized protein n=2 Tax=Sphingomonas gellani TaxID=1166340 RepID=A0A1H8DXW2_9SPHN|nr:hypothetical protein SAMN05192583_2097 [Sphingomonas gellani]